MSYELGTELEKRFNYIIFSKSYKERIETVIDYFSHIPIFN